MQIKSVLEKMGIIPRWMLTRTRLCKHRYGCYENVVLGFYHTFIKSLALKLMASNISSLMNFAKLRKNLTSWK